MRTISHNKGTVRTPMSVQYIVLDYKNPVCLYCDALQLVFEGSDDVGCRYPKTKNCPGMVGASRTPTPFLLQVEFHRIFSRVKEKQNRSQIGDLKPRIFENCMKKKFTFKNQTMIFRHRRKKTRKKKYEGVISASENMC